MELEKEMTVARAAKLLGLSPAKVYHMAMRGELNSRYSEVFKKFIIDGDSVRARMQASDDAK